MSSMFCISEKGEVRAVLLHGAAGHDDGCGSFCNSGGDVRGAHSFEKEVIVHLFHPRAKSLRDHTDLLYSLGESD